MEAFSAAVVVTLSNMLALRDMGQEPQFFGTRRLLQDGNPQGEEAIDITDLQTAISGALVFVYCTLSFVLKLGLTQTLFVASLRAAVQLVILGLILEPVFNSGTIWSVALVVFAMNTIGAREIYAATERYYPWELTHCWIATSVGGIVPTAYALAFVVKVDPWYKPQYVIPMIGMILGNVLKGIQLALDSACIDYTINREKVELFLARGGSRWEAGSHVVIQAARAGMMPTINFMSIMGLVSIPGMMTGQIMGGADPLLAAKYQIVIIFLICTATAIGTFLSLLLLHQVVFDKEHKLTVDGVVKRGKKGGDIVTEIFRLCKSFVVGFFTCCLLPCFKIFFWCFFRDEDYGYSKMPYEGVSIDYKDGPPRDDSFNAGFPKENSGGFGTAAGGLHWMNASFARNLPAGPGMPHSGLVASPSFTAQQGLMGSPSFSGAASLVGSPSFSGATGLPASPSFSGATGLTGSPSLISAPTFNGAPPTSFGSFPAQRRERRASAS